MGDFRKSIKPRRRVITNIRKLTACSIAALALSFVGVANAQQPAPVVTGYATAKACLQKVSVVKDGKTYALKEGVHFRSRTLSDDPDVVEIAGSGVSLTAGLREHAVWKTKVGEIEACMKLIPGLKFVDRTTN